MDNLKKYNEIFAEVFAIDESELNDNFSRNSNSSWDSIHQLNLITFIEDSFDIMFDGEDALSLDSYLKGKEILSTKYNIVF